MTWLSESIFRTFRTEKRQMTISLFSTHPTKNKHHPNLTTTQQKKQKSQLDFLVLPCCFWSNSGDLRWWWILYTPSTDDVLRRVGCRDGTAQSHDGRRIELGTRSAGEPSGRDSTVETKGSRLLGRGCRFRCVCLTLLQPKKKKGLKIPSLRDLF